MKLEKTSNEAVNRYDTDGKAEAPLTVIEADESVVSPSEQSFTPTCEAEKGGHADIDAKFEKMANRAIEGAAYYK